VSTPKKPARPDQFNLKLPPGTLQRWRAAATEMDLDLSVIVRYAMDAYLSADPRYAALGQSVADLVKRSGL
jgi:hypothetical protein